MSKTKCCPRVRIVCKRPKATTITESYWTLKNELSKPTHRKVSATVHKDARCAVKLGSETLLSNVKVDDPRLDKAVSRGQDMRVSRGCVAEAPALATVKPTPSTKFPEAPSEVLERLRNKAKNVK